jgi:hypothetical protein
MREFYLLVIVTLLVGHERLMAQGPTIDCSSNITAQACSPSGTVVNYGDPEINNPDNFWPIVSLDLIEGPPSGSTFPVGTTMVVYRLTYRCEPLYSLALLLLSQHALPPALHCNRKSAT